MGDLKGFTPKKVFVETLELFQLSELEIFIWKPVKEGLCNLTKGDIERYTSMKIDELEKSTLNAKTIGLAKMTQQIINKNKKTLLDNIKKKEENENAREI